MPTDNTSFAAMFESLFNAVEKTREFHSAAYEGDNLQLARYRKKDATADAERKVNAYIAQQVAIQLAQHNILTIGE